MVRPATPALTRYQRLYIFTKEEAYPITTIVFGAMAHRLSAMLIVTATVTAAMGLRHLYESMHLETMPNGHRGTCDLGFSEVAFS